MQSSFSSSAVRKRNFLLIEDFMVIDFESDAVSDFRPKKLARQLDLTATCSIRKCCFVSPFKIAVSAVATASKNARAAMSTPITAGTDPSPVVWLAY